MRAGGSQAACVLSRAALLSDTRPCGEGAHGEGGDEKEEVKKGLSTYEQMGTRGRLDASQEWHET